MRGTGSLSNLDLVAALKLLLKMILSMLFLTLYYTKKRVGEI